MHLGGWSLVIIHHLECFMQPSTEYSCSCLSTVHSNHRYSNIDSVRPWTMNGATAYFVGVYLFMQPVVFMTLLRGRENNKYQAEMKYEERILTNRGFKVRLRSHPRHRSLLLALLVSEIWITRSDKAFIVKHHPRHHPRKHQAPRHCQGRTEAGIFWHFTPSSTTVAARSVTSNALSQSTINKSQCLDRYTLFVSNFTLLLDF